MKKGFNMLKRLAVLLLAIILLFVICGCGDKEKDKYPKPTEAFFVNDFADLMTEQDEIKICEQGEALQEKTSAQAVVVTLESLDGKEISEYATDISNEWGIGDGDKDNGVVVLISEEDEEIYISIGDGLEGALPDSKTGRIIDNYAMPHLSSGDYSIALASVYNAIVNEVYIEYGIEPADDYTPIATLPEGHQTVQEQTGKVLISWIVLVVIIVLYVLVFGKRGLFIFGAPRFFGGFHFHGGGGFHGGGSSFGGFSGGGGHFSGGGAGRKF